MAIGTPYAAGPTTTSTTTTNAPTWTNSTSAVACSSGDSLFILYENRLNSSVTINSVSNNGGLTLTTSIVTGVNGGQNGNIYQIQITSASDIPINTQFTLNLSGSPTRHEIAGFGVSGVAAATPDANHIGTANGSGGTPSATTAGTTPASGDLAIGQWAHIGSGANGETGTPSTGFTEYQDGPTVGASTPFLHGYNEYQILGAGGAVTSNPSFASNTGGWLGQVVVYQPAAAGGTQYDITVNATAVSTTATVVRATSTTVAASAVGTTAGVKRSLSTAIAASAVSTAAAVKRALSHSIAASAVGTTAAVVRQLSTTITAGAVGTTASVVRQGQLNIAASAVSTVAAIQRQGLLNIVASAVGTTANVGVMFISGAGTTYFVTVNASAVGVSAGIVRQALLNIRASVSKGSGATTLGMTNQTLGGVVVQDVEGLLGRPFVGLRQNQGIATTGWTTASSQYDLGYVRTYRDVQADSAGDWAAVVAGTYDTDLTAIATNLMALSSKFNPQNPAIICFTHETSLSADIEGGVAGTAQEYIDAFRYVRDLWDGMGATVYSKTGEYLGGPIQMAYVGWDRMFTNGVVNSPDPGASYADFDPDQGSSPAPAGTSYYEFCGSDIYNALLAPGSLKYGNDAATLFDDVVTQATNRGKPFIVPEFGVGDGDTQTDHDNKAAWLASVQAYLEALPRSGAGSCEGVWLTFKNSADNFMVDSSPEALAAYQAFAQSPVFGTPVRLGPGVVRMAELGVATTVATTVSLSRSLAHTVATTVATTAGVARSTALNIRATVGSTARVVRKGLLGIAATVATAVTTALLRAIPASPNPERSNQITVDQGLNQIAVQMTVASIVVDTEPNQTVLTHNGTNLISVEEAAD